MSRPDKIANVASSAIQTKLEGQIITQKANLNAEGPQKDLKNST
jgi:hypothetical protein